MQASPIADLTTETRSTTGDIPPPLVGASTTIVGNCLYVFGGRLVASRQMTNHLYILNLTTLVWERHIAPPDSDPAPLPRYFHSANIYKNSIVIFGGMSNARRNSASAQGLCTLDDLCIFDLDTLCWRYPAVAPSIYTPQARYAHMAVSSHDKLIVIGGQDMLNQYINEINVFDLKQMCWVQGGPVDQQYGAYRSVAFCPLASSQGQSPLWPAGETQPSDLPVCIYSNYNFADVTRDLQSCRPLQDSGIQFRNHSDAMKGSQLPPGLRFPSGHLLGHHMIMTGTLLTPTHRAFHLWALNLANLVWVRIDTGNVLAQGSWNRGILDHDQQKFYVIGNRQRDLLEDYNHRQINFDHVAVVDLESFGIYTHPEQTCAPIAQELGLSMLNEPGMADMEIVSNDQKAIPINSTILAQRWPFFDRLIDHQSIHNKRLHFTESYTVTLAFLQFLYTDHLLTAQQHQPSVLSRLLLLAHMFDIPRLMHLTTHALHQVLTITTSHMVYETAALTGRTALQIRALRVMINTRKLLQQQQQQQQQQQRQVSTSPSHPPMMNAHPPATMVYSPSFQNAVMVDDTNGYPDAGRRPSLHHPHAIHGHYDDPSSPFPSPPPAQSHQPSMGPLSPNIDRTLSHSFRF
ncbi:galactose oxidase [Hesseltinella vesiculosa]|uniref:Galactose oxidase n=1 Tax=Hesseltinella vesiculosa TaxID=101127 RepID=A0A1X2GX73_9FUNG|nr:galactose oxidase [Hesseltinella vesiculosa]